MRITVHRGCVTEYESNGWRLFVALDEQRLGAPMSDKALEVEGLTHGDLGKSALLITHCHDDHIGKIADLPPELTVFKGNTASGDAFVPGEQFTFGEFNIMPIAIDRANVDAYAFRIDAERLKVFHTDFLTPGFRSGKLMQVIEKYVGKVDYVVAGTDYERLHTDGQCEMACLDGPLDILKPKAIIPVHTDSPRRFADLFSDRWPVILLEDRESFAPIYDPGYDNTMARIIACQTPDDSYKTIENPEDLKWWTVDNRYLGEFMCWDDADFALRHAAYAPKRVIACSIETIEDMAPWVYVVYNPDFSEHSEYNEGGHAPGGPSYQQDCGYAPGQRILAIIDDVLVPCEVVGPLTPDFLKKEFEQDDFRDDIPFEEYLKQLWDWDWDKVVVRPLVKIETKYGEIATDTTAQRIYLFPYYSL